MRTVARTTTEPVRNVKANGPWTGAPNDAAGPSIMAA